MQKILYNRVLIKKIETPTETVSGLTLMIDADSLPQAEIVMLSAEVKGIVEVGDRIYYQESRERGRCKYKGEDHFIIPIANVIAII